MVSCIYLKFIGHLASYINMYWKNKHACISVSFVMKWIHIPVHSGSLQKLVHTHSKLPVELGSWFARQEPMQTPSS